MYREELGSSHKLRCCNLILLGKLIEKCYLKFIKGKKRGLKVSY